LNKKDSKSCAKALTAYAARDNRCCARSVLIRIGPEPDALLFRDGTVGRAGRNFEAVAIDPKL